MRRRSLVTFIILNIFISLGVAFAVISIFGNDDGDAGSAERGGVTFVPVLVTATVNPNETPNVIIVTATPGPGTQVAAQVQVPTDLLETPDLTQNPVATIDPDVLAGDSDLQRTATALPPNCILHTVESGDTPFGIAEIYGVDGFDLLEVNALDEEAARFLAVGDLLIVPLEGCELTASEVFTPIPADDSGDAESQAADGDAAAQNEEETPDVTPTPSSTPTATLPPTATDAQVEIVRIVGAGDITAEGVEIRNLGSTVNIEDWTLTDRDGNVYTFDEQLLFSNALVTVFSRVGQDTPAALFWGRTQAVWDRPDDAIILADADGNVQAVLELADT
ncbi:MAG: LysM peptidoglycan-binding domain-containing protein [Chloroflexi bacterium]|nr:MAG: hypothetical protein CUN54_02940 [Phototrophicales bacterium]RMF82824.1 MAG: LysM peptidoglycan-binding domain-containing protein [Chloroflexota bacterium]